MGTATEVTVAVHQPGYHRHLYYFGKMLAADVFVSLDTVQFAAREWQNRQQFLHAGTRRWLSVPVNRGREPIRDKRITDQEALHRHWTTIRASYRSTPYFSDYEERLEEIYRAGRESLSGLCDALTAVVRDALGIATPYLRASDLLGTPTVGRGDLLGELALAAAHRSAPAGSRVTYLACAAPMRPAHYLLRPSSADPGMTERRRIEARGVRLDMDVFRQLSEVAYRQHVHHRVVERFGPESVCAELFSVARRVEFAE